MNKFLTLIFCVFSVSNLYSQTNNSTDFIERPTSILEVTQDLGPDTLIFYYNDNWQLVKPICGTIIRISRVDTLLGTFTGNFADYYLADSIKAVEGSYFNGKKEGRFNIYFKNGQLEQTGNYLNDKKSGVWEYFYEDGTQRQIFDFQENEILIKEFWDKKGKKLVDAANGVWFSRETSDQYKKTSGKIVNGRKNGTWVNSITSKNILINIERYNEGKFLSGKSRSPDGQYESYNDTIHCSVEYTPAFVDAEQFTMNRCYKSENIQKAQYPGGIDKFYNDLSEKITANGSIRTPGMITIRTLIDTDGKMTDFKILSNIGYEFEVIQILKSMRNWTPAKRDGKPITDFTIIRLKVQ